MDNLSRACRDLSIGRRTGASQSAEDWRDSDDSGVQAADTQRTTEPAVHTLTDDGLLQVLLFLSPGELLQCRAVCRRWRSLALHPWLWRRKSLFWEEHEVVAALRLAPSLRSLAHKSSMKGDFAKTAQWVDLLSTTCCAVSKISVRFRVKDATLVAGMLARQASLGRLKEISLYEIWPKVRMEDVEREASERSLGALLFQLCHTQGLESVHLDNIGTDDSLWDLSAMVRAWRMDTKNRAPASLKRLHYDNDVWIELPLDPFVLLLLEWHAATLEDVSLVPDAPGLASLLSSMPRLRRLDCNYLENMPALLKCASLKSLRLHCYMLDGMEQPLRARVPGLAVYLRTAVTQLEDLDIFFDEDEEPIWADVVRCLGGTEKSPAALRSLKIDTLDCPENIILLTTILHRLPHLTDLHVDVREDAMNALLEALDGKVLPRLSMLRGRYLEHQWGHSEPVEKVLRNYAQLHICGVVTQWPKGHCESCGLGPVNDGVNRTCMIFSHPQGAPCKESRSHKLFTEMHVNLGQ